MSPSKRKGERPPPEAAQDEGARKSSQAGRQVEEELDPREEDGWSQPESSAQKGPATPPRGPAGK